MRIRVAALAFLLALSLTHLLQATPLAGDTPLPNAAQPYPNYFGQSFTVNGTGSYNDIQFDFLSPASSPFATGTGFLLSQEYLGSPGSLGASTPGYLGSASAVNGYYSFGSNVSLLANQKYYLYDNVIAPGYSIGSYYGPAYLGPSAPSEYYATSTSSFISYPTFSWAFQVTGDPAVTPEPSTLALLGTGVLGLAGAIRRRMVASSYSPDTVKRDAR